MQWTFRRKIFDNKILVSYHLMADFYVSQLYCWILSMKSHSNMSCSNHWDLMNESRYNNVTEWHSTSKKEQFQRYIALLQKFWNLLTLKNWSNATSSKLYSFHDTYRIYKFANDLTNIEKWTIILWIKWILNFYSFNQLD